MPPVCSSCRREREADNSREHQVTAAAPRIPTPCRHGPAGPIPVPGSSLRRCRRGDCTVPRKAGNRALARRSAMTAWRTRATHQLAMPIGFGLGSRIRHMPTIRHRFLLESAHYLRKGSRGARGSCGETVRAQEPACGRFSG